MIQLHISNKQTPQIIKRIDISEYTIKQVEQTVSLYGRYCDIIIKAMR